MPSRAAGGHPVLIPGRPRGVLFAGCPDGNGTPFSYAREEEVYGEGEETEFVYEVAPRPRRFVED